MVDKTEIHDHILGGSRGWIIHKHCTKYEHVLLGKQPLDAKKINFSSWGCIPSVNRLILGPPAFPKTVFLPEPDGGAV